jgi:hydroxyethylthiazole kinase-like uncharacterized protein yjeF
MFGSSATQTVTYNVAIMNDRILTTRELRHIEARHAAAVPPLMQRAGTAATTMAGQMLTDTPGKLLIAVGPGNNGGDAFVIARLLLEAGLTPTVLFAEEIARLPPDAQAAANAYRAAGGTYTADFPEGKFCLIVDGLFGTGLTRPIAGRYADWIARINAAHAPVLALDVPSGLNADTGAMTGPCIRATATATFIALKPGLLTGDGPDFCGRIEVCPLDLDTGAMGGETIAQNRVRNCLLPRPHNTHKGSFGCVAIIGGAPGMAGAALLAGRAALNLGAGRVCVGMLDPLPVDIGQPELMLHTPEVALAAATVVALGPGLGQSAVARQLLMRCAGLPLPIVIDADGLNLLAEQPEVFVRIRSAVPPAPTFLTPHPAEAARLLMYTTTAQVQADRLAAARALAEKFNAYVALKGCGTVIATPDGHWFINTNGNPGLATAGSGDVLTGMLAALLAQDCPPLEAQLAAVHLHGAAADACVTAGHGPVGLTAGELIPLARHLLNRWINA